MRRRTGWWGRLAGVGGVAAGRYNNNRNGRNQRKDIHKKKTYGYNFGSDTIKRQKEIDRER